ncbi:MAG: spore germination protein [Thermoanaerobacter sp.]|jgi:spore germination protein YaaH|nr:spore germination protein [Thermoanaerobacter sp.]
MFNCRKKLIPLLILMIFTFNFTCIAYASQYLRQGDYGPDVVALQEKLRQMGYLAAPATGYFGPLTEAAVIKLQADYNLIIDGIVGPQTSALLTQLTEQKIPSRQKKIIMGYYTGKETPLPSSLSSLSNHGSQLTFIAPFRYRLNASGTGSLDTLGDIPEKEFRELFTVARQNKVKVLALVHNLLYGNGIQGRDVAHRILSDPQKRWSLVMNIFYLLKENGFDGVEIDIEDIYPSDRQLFNQFLIELAAQLKPAGYYISVALPAKTSDAPSMSWGDSFDYATIGRYADQVVVMAYDEHGAYSGPGPIASLPWVEKVVQYTVSKIPAPKVMLGIPAYGFDWNYDGGFPRYLSHELALETARWYGAPVRWNTWAQAPYFTYIDENGSRHEVWFENASSWAGKLDLITRYNLKGAAIWRLGMEDPDSWRVIGEKFITARY